MITVLKIEYKVNDVAEVTFINENSMFELVLLSNELMDKILKLDKLKLIIKSRNDSNQNWQKEI
jgi:hypothetical protein